MVIEIPITKNKFTLIDDEDYELVNKYKWIASYCEGIDNYYVTCRINNKTIYLHRLVMGFPIDFVIDHKDKNTLNNQKSNLRLCTRSQNQCNRSKHSNNKSGYKGVWYDKPRNKWQAEIQYENKKKHLGRFNTPEEAAIYRDAVAIQLHGEFAVLNFPNCINELPYIDVSNLFKDDTKIGICVYKGVTIDKRCTKRMYRVYVKHNNKNIFCGNFKSKIEAALVYDENNIKYKGIDAYTNFPEYSNIDDFDMNIIKKSSLLIKVI